MAAMSAEVEQMMHSLENRYVKLRDEHAKVTSQRDDLLGRELALQESLSEEQRQLSAMRAQVASVEAAALDQKRYFAAAQMELTVSKEVSTVRD